MYLTATGTSLLGTSSSTRCEFNLIITAGQRKPGIQCTRQLVREVRLDTPAIQRPFRLAAGGFLHLFEDASALPGGTYGEARR